MPTFQGFRRNCYCKIIVDGQDVTSKVEPFLESVTVRSCEGAPGSGTDTCSIECDDRDARLAIPPDGGEISIYLGWDPTQPKLPASPPTATDVPADPSNGESLPYEGGLFLVFLGEVAQVESGFSRRGGGRRLWIEGTGMASKGGAKTPNLQTWGRGVQGSNITLEQMLKEAGQKIGISVKVSPSMKTITRNFWEQNGESFMHLGSKLAAELGGVFKISRNSATMVSASDGLNADGEPFGTIDAYWGSNLISWRIKPFIAKPQFKDSQAPLFNRWLGEWQDVIGKIPGTVPFGRADARMMLPRPAPNAQVGKQTNDGVRANSKSNSGTGWAIINGEPRALAGRWLNIVGARPGVDGMYTIYEAEHIYNRGGGYITRCSLRDPKLSDTGYAAFSASPIGAAINALVPTDI